MMTRRRPTQTRRHGDEQNIEHEGMDDDDEQSGVVVVFLPTRSDNMEYYPSEMHVFCECAMASNVYERLICRLQAHQTTHTPWRATSIMACSTQPSSTILSHNISQITIPTPHSTNMTCSMLTDPLVQLRAHTDHYILHLNSSCPLSTHTSHIISNLHSHSDRSYRARRPLIPAAATAAIASTIQAATVGCIPPHQRTVRRLVHHQQSHHARSSNQTIHETTNAR